MTIDISRDRFNPKNNYSGVRWQQGRVRLDSEDNEDWSINDRRWRVETTDVVGRCGVPQETPDGFAIGIDNGELTIGPGRMYIHGLLAENHGNPPTAFNPILAEDYGTNPILFTEQPFVVDISADPPSAGQHLVYLKAWYRDVTFLEDPDLMENAVNVDTTARIQTAWQVGVLANVGDITCETPDNVVPGYEDLIRPSDGRLSSQGVAVASPNNPCLLPPKGGYLGLENRMYRVEVHDESPVGSGNFRFKWSRYNGTVATRVNAIPSLTQLQVASVGRDDVLRFHDGDWVEILDDHLEFSGQPGVIRRILHVNPDTNTIELEPGNPIPGATFPTIDAQGTLEVDRHTRLRRWDQSGQVRDTNNNLLADLDDPTSEGLIPVPAAGTSIVLEDGVQITFGLSDPTGNYKQGDFWIFHARTADASVEELVDAPPKGIHYHYCRLALVTSNTTDYLSVDEDCRDDFPPLIDLEPGCCTVVVEPGQSIQAAIDSLPPEGGCVCLKTGVHQINDVIRVEGSNIKITGESPGTIVQRRNGIPMLRLENSQGTLIERLEIKTIRFETLGETANEPGEDPNAFAEGIAIINMDLAHDVLIHDCEVDSTNHTAWTVGIYIKESEAISVDSCALINQYIGIWSAEDSSHIMAKGNHLESTLTKNDIGSYSGIVIQNSFGKCCVDKNRIVNHLTGIIINDNVFASPPSSNAHGSSVQDNEIIGTVFSLNNDNTSALKFFLIDVAANDCLIVGNKISYSSPNQGGIRSYGDDCTIRDNHIEFIAKGGDQPIPAIGILIGEINQDQSSIIDRTQVIANRVLGPQIGILGFNVDEINISQNFLYNPEAEILIGIGLSDSKNATVRDNQINNASFGIFLSEGTQNKLINNSIIQGNIGISLLLQSEIDVHDNRLELMRTSGILCIYSWNRTTFVGNHLQSCGFASPVVAIGLGVFLVFGELLVKSCNIQDTGTGSDNQVATPAIGLYGLLILETQVEGNLITYSNVFERDVAAEDRAVLLSGLLEFSVVLADRPTVFGFCAQVTNNKFIGTGGTALVQFLSFNLTDQVRIRFERVTFNDNYCMHHSGPFNRQGISATVIMNARSNIVMGNHIKGNLGFPSVNFNNSKGVFMGNDTTGSPRNFVDFPSPRTNFNLS